MPNWNTTKKRALMARRGTTGGRGMPGIMGPLMRVPKATTLTVSKAEQRAQAAAALEQWRQQKGVGG